jgi:hypothetical protein
MADFKLGRIKFKWRGDWAASSAYVIDDIVKYGGNAYVCIQNHTSPANENLFYTSPGTFTEYWQLHQESFYFKGAYANTTWYKLNDLVSYGGKQYRTTTAHTSSSLVLDQSKFEQYSDGIIFKGDYASSTQYKLNDLVKYGGRTYRCTTEHTSAAGGDANIVLGNFALYSEGLAFKGDFQVNTYYKLDDVVKFGAYQYKCIVAHTSGGALSDFAEANFTVYSEGLQFEDSYNASTLYQKGDVVTYGGYSYAYINDNESTGQTPADNAYWDVVTTGFKATGVYSHGTLYKTGDTVQYGGNHYVCILDAQNQRPAEGSGAVNSTYWKQVIGGFNYRGAYTSFTTYEVGDVVRHISSSYVNLKDQVLNVEPGTDGLTWQAIAQGDTGAVMTARGDLIRQDAGGTARLPLGLPGAVLTNDGDDAIWSGISGKNVLWVSPKGEDGGPGTESLPYLTLQYAAKHAKPNSIREIKNQAGGTGGTADVYDEVQGFASKEFTVATVPDSTSFTINMGTSTLAHAYVNGGTVRKANDSTLTISNAVYVHGTGVITITTPTHGLGVSDKIRVSGLNFTCSKGAKTYPEVGSPSLYRVNTVTSPPTVEIINGGSDHNVGDKIRIDGSDIGLTGLTGGDITTSTTHGRSVGDLIEVRDLLVSCPTGNKTYPIHSTNTAFTVEAANLTTTDFQVDLGTSNTAQTYVSGGEVVKANGTRLAITDFVYNTTTGKAVITTATNGLSASDTVNLFGIQTTCEFGTKVYPQAPYSGVYPVVSSSSSTKLNFFLPPSNVAHTYVSGGTVKLATVSSVGGSTTISGATYDNVTGLFTVTSTAHGLVNNDLVKVENILMSCSMGSKTYPDNTFSSGIFKVYNVVDANTYIFGTDKSGLAHTYVSGGTSQKVTYTTSEGKSVDDFTYNRIASSTPLTFDVKSVAGDIIRLKNGTFKEQLPIRVRKGVSIVGESLRNTRVQPATGTGSQIATVTMTGNVAGAIDGQYKYIHQERVAKPFSVQTVPDATSFTINVGTDTRAHTYVSGGLVVDSGFTEKTITNAPYVHGTGVITITTLGNHGLSVSDIVKVSGMKYTCVDGEKTYPEVGQGSVWNVVISGGTATEVITYHGGSGFSVGDVITLKKDDIGGAGGDITLTVAKLEDNNASNFFLCNDANNIRNMTFTGLNAQKKSGGLYQVATVGSTTSFTVNLGTSAYAHTYISGGHVIKAGSESTTLGLANASYAFATGPLTVDTSSVHGLSVGDWVTLGKMKFTCDLGEKIYPSGPMQQAVMSLDPSGNIKLTSPYIQNCTSINPGACGIQVDGNLHKNTEPNSYKSMLGNDFTQINEDGIGIHILGKGRVEAVSVFIYYCEKAVYAESGGFIRALNCSHSYGEKACVASGTDEDETPVNVQTRGMMLAYDSTTFQSGFTASDIENSIATQGQGTATITGNTSGATAKLFRYNVSLGYLHIENIVGNFIQDETITITKEDSTVFTVDLSPTFGDSAQAQQGQRGPLLAIKSGTTALNTANIIALASNIKFTGDTKYFRVGLVSEEDTTNETAVIRLTEDIGMSKAKVDGVSTNITERFSNIRLTGHDFLNIGTGDFTTTNYPGIPTQPADQSDEITEENGGRIYWVSTDQQGDFRVGDLFKIEQATGTATLNADAFNLSGLSELKLGSIGAELGAAVNEFSTDQTLGGNSNTAVPTENAVLGYMTRNKAGVKSWVPPTGTTAQRPISGDLYSGAIRFNTSIVAWEGYNGSSWTGLGGGTPWTTVTADGSTIPIAEGAQKFLIDTTLFPQTIKLPAAPLVGDSIAFLDLGGTFQTNNLTVGRNGNDIMNLAEDMVADVNHAGFTLLYTGNTNGWKLVEVA